MIVRLKVTLVINEDDFYNGFNSMIVRLKVFIRHTIYPDVIFQFYDSPIKSMVEEEFLPIVSDVSIL